MFIFVDQAPATAMPLWAIILYPVSTAIVTLIVAYTALLTAKTEDLRKKDKEQADRDKAEQLQINKSLLDANTQTQRIAKATFDTVLKASDQQFSAIQGVEALKAHFNIPAPVLKPTEDELILQKVQDFIQQFLTNKNKMRVANTQPTPTVIIDSPANKT